MNCGFEDCRILDELADSSNEDWQQILQKYQQLRKPDGDAIADLAVNNFIEMRDKTKSCKQNSCSGNPKPVPDTKKKVK